MADIQDTLVEAYRGVINTSTKSKKSLMADSELYAERLASVVGGINGKISPATGFGCTDGLTVQEQGTVSNVMPFTGQSLNGEPVPDSNLYLREARFVNRLTAGTVSLIQRFHNYDPDVLSPAFSMPSGRTDQDRVRHAAIYSTDYRSTLYSLMITYLNDRMLMRSDINYLKMLLLEGMHLYLELYQLKNGPPFTSDITSQDMSQFLQNIEAVIQYFMHQENRKMDLERYDIIHELRQLEKNALGAKTDVIDYL